MEQMSPSDLSIILQYLDNLNIDKKIVQYFKIE